jgi:hypothetical protein
VKFHDGSGFHEQPFVKRFAVSRGMEVNRDNTSKDIIIASGSTFKTLSLVGKSFTLLTVCGDFYRKARTLKGIELRK